MTTFLGWLCTPDAGCYLGLATYNARHYDYFSWLVVYTCHPVLVVWDANYHDQHIFVPALFIITLMLRVHDLCILSLQPSFRQPGNMLRVPKLNDVTDTCQFLLDYIFTYICIKSYSFILLFEVYKVYGITHFRGIL